MHLPDRRASIRDRRKGGAAADRHDTNWWYCSWRGEDGEWWCIRAWHVCATASPRRGGASASVTAHIQRVERERGSAAMRPGEGEGDRRDEDSRAGDAICPAPESEGTRGGQGQTGFILVLRSGVRPRAPGSRSQPRPRPSAARTPRAPPSCTPRRARATPPRAPRAREASRGRRVAA